VNRTTIRALLVIVIICALVSFARSADSEGNEKESDEYIYIPAIYKYVPPPIVNGNFEAGVNGWGQYSANGWPLIVKSDVLLVPPHSGVWAVWLGGDDNEDAVLWQVVKVPASSPKLTYWLWIASGDACGYDVAGVAINLDEVVDAYWLCYVNNTGGWIKRTVDLSPYAGQTVELDFVAFTDDVLNSNLFIDDVSLGDSSASPAENSETHDVTSNNLAVNLKETSISGFEDQLNPAPGTHRLETTLQKLQMLLSETGH